MTKKYTPDPVPYTPAPTPYTPVSTPYTPTSLPYTPAPTPYTPAPVSYQEYRNEYKDPNAYDASQYLSRFNDPFAINSILDVISNEAALIKHYGSSDVSSRFKALRDLFWLRTWKPISQGDFGTAALNLIPAITEPLDVLGNIAKALLSPAFASDAAQVDYDTAEQILVHHANKPTPVLWDEKGRPISYSAYVNGKHYRYSNRELAMYENIVNSGRTVNPYKLTTSERLKASIGLGEHGRINFNYDTNSLLVDMFLEIVTDPQTIISIGAGALTGVVENSLEKSVKTFLKEGDTALLRAMPGLSKEAANDILTMVAKQTSEKAMYKQVTEYLLKKEITIAANEPAKAWLTRLLGKAVNETTATKTYAIKNLADALSVTLFYSQKGVNADTVKQTADILQRAMSKYVNHTAINVLKTVKLTDDVLNAAQSALTKAALSPSGIYPTYKLIQKGVPQVADWVNNLLKASTELYTNESGRCSIISFSDGLSNFYKTNLTIADGLGDELAALYNPKYIAQFYPQMAVDRVMLGDIFSKLSKANVDETLAAYRAYMKANHHGFSIRELADAAQKADHLLEGADIQTTAYAKYLNQLSERISKIEAGVEFVRKANAANKIVEVASIDAIPKAHIFLLQENLLKIPDVTLAVEATAKQLEEMLYEFVKPVRLLSDTSAGLAKKFREDMTALYGKYFHEFIKNKDATVNAYEISRRLTQYTEDVQNILDRLYTRKASIVREESALQALKRVIASNEKNVKKFTETADALSEAAIKQRKVTGDYAVFNSNSSETVMDSPFVKSKAVKDLFGDIDLTDPKAVKDWYTPIREWQSIREPAPSTYEDYVVTKYKPTHTTEYIPESKLQSAIVSEFRGEHSFLSNFYPVDIAYEGKVYPSVENAFQAAKTLDPKAREIFEHCTPSQAKKLGRSVALRSDWNEVRTSVMEELLQTKFKKVEMRKALLGTGNAPLQEGNRWGDTFWGIDLKTGKGKNNLGELLMKVRKDATEELKRVNIPVEVPMRREIRHSTPLTKYVWRNDTVIKTFNNFFSTPLNAPGYDKAFGQFQRFMKNLESTMTHWFKAGSEELISFNSIMEELNLISPYMLKKRAKAVDEWTTYFRLKIENLAMLVTSVEDKRVIDFITQIQTGNFSKLTQEFLEAGGADAADKALVEQINNLAKQFIATKTLLSELNEAAIDETTRAGLLSSLSSFSYRPSESLSSDVTSFLKRLIERAEVNVQQTFQRDEALNLDFIFQKYRDAINKSRSVFGLEPLLKEAHIGADDIITTDFVLTELLKDNTDVSALLKSNRKRVAFDFETWHTDVSTGNQLHQGAISVFENNKVRTQAFGLHSDTIADGFFPGPDYLNKLFPNMSREAQEKAYLASRSGAFRSEAELIEAIVKHLWNEVKDTYDETADAFSAVFVTHHGAGFDLPLLKIKANQYGIDKIMDISFLDKVEMFDTYKLLREQKNYFAITTDEVTELLPIFQRYGEAMTEAKATRLFNAMSTEELLTIKEKLVTTGMRKKLSKEFIQTFDELSQSLEGALDVFKEIKHTNELLGSKLYPKHLFTSTLENGVSSMQNATKEQWIEFLHSLGFNDKQIAKQFGDLDSLNATAIIGAIGSEAGVAYAKAVDDVLVDKWFVGTAARVGDASASRELTEMLTNVARKIDNYAKNFFAPDEFLPYKEIFKDMTDTLIRLKKGTAINPNNLLGTVIDGVPGPRYLQYLRTENLNIREQWALLRYMKDISDRELWNVMIGHVFTVGDAEDELDTIKGLLKSFGGKELLVTPKYVQHSEFTNAVVDYTEQYFSLLNLTSNFDQFSKYLDDPGEHMEPIFEGSAQLHRRAAEPIVKVLKDLKKGYESEMRTISGHVDAVRQYAKEVRGADQMSQKIIRSFINKDLDEVIPWMVDAKLPVMFPTGEITTAEHTAFINKFTSAPFREANIEVHTEGYWTYVWLTKNAKVHATVDEDDVVTYLVNGKTYSKPIWEQLDAEEMVKLAYSFEEELDEGLIVSVPMLKPKKVFEAIEALSFMTDGASGHSMYELLKQTDLERIMNKLPAKVLESMPELDSFKNPAMWLGSQFNHAVLGSSSARREYLEYSSGHLMLNLQNATYNRLRDHGTVNVYAQALMNNTTAVQNTAIGNIMRDYPEDFMKYIGGNPEYTVAALVPAKNKLGYKVKGFNLNTKAGVKAAYEANANIMTISEFNKLYEVINQNIWSETWMSTWLSLVRLFKIGYLGVPGTWTRNLYDTVIKNTQVTGENPFVVAKQYATAFKDLRDYDKIVQMLHDLGDELAGNDEALRAFFKGSSIMDYDKYQFLHRFFNDAAAGGEASIYRVLNKPKQDSYWEALLKYGAVTPEMKTSFERKRWFNNITNAALNPMNEIERVARLAEYQLFTKQGLTNTKAIHLIEKTHYAYSVKSTVEQTMELLIPFYTFANRNLQYWMEVVEKDPTFLVGLRDFLDPLWNLDQYNADEMQNSNSLQNNIFSGNIPLGDSDWYLKTGFSFMDAFQILTDPINQTKSRIFSPVQAVVDVLLQRGSDELYKANRETASNWLQNTFGTKITQAQLEAKYGDWAAEYQKLYPYKVSSENPMSDLLEVFKAWQYVPLIGTQISRFENTNLYYDGDGAKKLLYLTGLAGKRTAWSAEDAVNSREKLRYKISALIEDSSTIKYKWQEVLHRNGYGDSVNLYMLNHNELERLWNELSEGYKKVNTELYEYLQKDDDYIWMYSRLRAALGYADVPMSQLPVEVREMLLAVMKEQGTNVDISPVLQEQAEFTFMWAATKRKYGYADAKYAEIPSTDMDKICLDIAKGAMVLTDIRNMLATDPSTRYSYSVAKQNLGYGELQLYQLPTDALKLLKAAMVNKVYGVGAAASSTNIYAQAPKPKRMYAKQTWTNQTPYNTSKGVYANYGHASTQMSTQMQGLASNKGAYLSHRPNVYGNSYTKTGKSRMQTRMMPVTPRNLLPQIKSLFSYYR